MNGVDHVEPHTAIPALVRKLSSLPDQHAQHSTLPAYVAAVRTAVDSMRPDLETVTGELRGGTDYANLLPGVLSTRVYLKQQNARVQTLLESYAEPLSAVRVARRSALSAGACGTPGRRCCGTIRMTASAAAASPGARRERDPVRPRPAGR